MTDIKPQALHRAQETSPPRRRRWWIWALVALVVVAGGVLAVVLLWPEEDEAATPVPGELPSQPADVPATVLPPSVEDEVPATQPPPQKEDEVVAPVGGELAWSQVADAPAPFFAIAATPEGFLAAAPASGGGVEIWTSPNGEAWELLVSDQTAFEADEVVWRLSRGPSGFVAVAMRVSEGESDSGTVWTSPDGETWHRSYLAAGLDDPATPYLRYWFDVAETVSGPEGFVALGSSSLWLDTDAILADFAPEASTDHYMVGEGPSTIEISTEDGTEIVVTYTELGITPGQRDEMRAAVPTLHLWWSGDGISWVPIDTTEMSAQLEDAAGSPEEGLSISHLVGSDDGFYLFAGSRLGFQSTDGRTWTPFQMQGLPEEFGYGLVEAIRGGFMLFGGEEAHGYFSGGPGEQSVWTSPDGRNWTRGTLEVPGELGQGLEFEAGEVVAGPMGILVQGGTMQVVERVQSVVLVKDGYVVTMAMDSWTLADEATGEFIGETGDGIEIGDSPTGAGTFPIVDSVTGEELLVITEEDIVAAEEAALGGADPGRAEPDHEPIELLAFSSDGTTWTTDELTGLFGDDAGIFRLAVGADRAVALILTDFDAMMEYGHEGDVSPPPIHVWVGELGG